MRVSCTSALFGVPCWNEASLPVMKSAMPRPVMLPLKVNEPLPWKLATSTMRPCRNPAPKLNWCDPRASVTSSLTAYEVGAQKAPVGDDVPRPAKPPVIDQPVMEVGAYPQ